MKIEQSTWSEKNGWDGDKPFGTIGESAQLVLVFSSASRNSTAKCLETIKAAYPNAHICGCSTAGEIQGIEVLDASVAVSAIAFEHTKVKAVLTPITSVECSFHAGQKAAKALEATDLKHVFVLSEGLKVNGSDLLRGLNAALPNGVTISGGFAGDCANFQNTYIWCDGEPVESSVVTIGFYGDRLQVALAATGGWDPFGPDRIITKSKNNVVYEIDGRSALALYKEYLGEHADGLPASGLLYPMQLKIGDTEERILRTLLAVDEAEQSLTFAGEIPQGCLARLMYGNLERLIEGVTKGAQVCVESLKDSNVELGILVSCVGRRPVLKQRIEEELEAVSDIFGARAALTGFYSYGEIAPTLGAANAEIHNQTMTMTCLSEI